MHHSKNLKVIQKIKKLSRNFDVLRVFWFCVINRGQNPVLEVRTYEGGMGT